MSKYKLMDKVTIYKVDTSKELIPIEITGVTSGMACSGGVSYEINSKEECYIFKIEETITEEYSLTDQYDDGELILNKGLNRSIEIKYYLTGISSPISESYLDSYTNIKNEESYQRYLTKKTKTNE